MNKYKEYKHKCTLCDAEFEIISDEEHEDANIEFCPFCGSEAIEIDENVQEYDYDNEEDD